MVQNVFYDSPRMVSIIDCESNYVHYKQDGGVLAGRVDPRDRGVAQVNTFYHPTAETEEIWSNLGYARKLYESEGVQPWVCNQHVAGL